MPDATRHINVLAWLFEPGFPSIPAGEGGWGGEHLSSAQALFEVSAVIPLARALMNCK